MNKKQKVANLRNIRHHLVQIVSLYKEMGEDSAARWFELATADVDSQIHKLDRSPIKWEIGDLALDKYDRVWEYRFTGWFRMGDTAKTLTLPLPEDFVEQTYGPLRRARVVEEYLSDTEC